METEKVANEKMSNVNVLKAYVLAVNEMKNPVNLAENSYHHSKYAPLSEVIEKVKPVLAKHDLAFMQIPYVQYEAFSDNKQVAVVSIETKLVHISGEMIEFPPVIIKTGNINPQAVGSVITYCRRYSLSSIFGLAGKEEDDDGNLSSLEYPHPQQQVAIEQNQIQKVQQQETPSVQEQPTQQQVPQQSTNQTKQANVELNKVMATVVSKKEGKSGKGTPYVEVTLEANGKQITAIAKEQGIYEKVTAIKEGETAKFGILSMQGFYFIRSVEQIQGANANE